MTGRSRGPLARWSVLAVLVLVAVPAATRAVPALEDVRPWAGPDPAVGSAIANVSLQRLYADLYALQNFSTRYVYSAGIVGASQYIFDRFAETPGLRVEFQNFTYQGTPLRNVVAVLPGMDAANETLYVLGAHYDSITMGPGADPMTWAPGADDDGSGTVGVIEAARVLSRYRFNATLVFAAWSAEEVGLVGSDFYCTCLAGSSGKVGLYVNLDMIGNDPMDTQAVYVIHDRPSEWAADEFLTLVNDYGLGLWAAKVYDTAANSDHASFWAQGYPAIFLVEADFSPNWHRPTDTIDNVNMNLVTNTTQGAAGLLATMAGIQNPDRGAVFFDRNAYGVDGVAELTLGDADLNGNPVVAETAPLLAASPQEPAGEAFTLVETGPDTGVFRGTLRLGTAPSVPGVLQVAPGATITASYADASPAGTRTDTATIDGTAPAIRNVAAVPGITTATVAWGTSEPTDGTVTYGTSPSLGVTNRDPRPSTVHRLELAGLQPDTTYYFDVRSSDEAGQTAVADNGGAHFAFRTLTGLAAIPTPGHVGYVRSGADPQPNFLSSDRMLSGFSAATGRTYRAAAQFDTSGVSIPVGGVVTDAWLDLHAQEWAYSAPGQWRVEYLNGSIDANWPIHNYAILSAAAADFQIPPTLANADLRPGEWLRMLIPAAQYAAVRNRVGAGAVSIRIDGPTSGLGSIFGWATGYPAPCAALPARQPRFSVTYSAAGDIVGPTVTSWGGNPNPTMAAATTTLTATISDAAAGDTPIANAEFFVGADPGVGRGTPMGAADGSFDTPIEDAMFEFDVTGTPSGVYAFWVRARDRAGNWGAARTFDLYVGVWDLLPPSVDALFVDPPVAELGFETYLGAAASDDVGVASLTFAVRDSTAAVGNFSAAVNGTSGRWEFTRAYAAGTYTVTAWAQDGSGRFASASGAFAVGAGEPPRADAGPDRQVGRGQTATLDGTGSTDDVGITEWEWTVTGPGGTWTFATPVATFAPDVAGTYTATLRVWDAAGRIDEDSAVVTVFGPSGPAGPAWDWGWLILLAALLVGVAITIVYLRRRRKAERPPSEPT